MPWTDNYEFSIRAYHVLNVNNVGSAQEAIKLGLRGLTRFPNCGPRTAEEILRVLSKDGYSAESPWRSLLCEIPNQMLLDELKRRLE